MADLNQVFAALEPYRVLAALAIPLSTANGAGQFESDGRTYWFDRRKIVALDWDAPFVAGDIVDFVTQRKGLHVGIQWLVDEFRSQLPAHLLVDVTALARQAERRQRHLHAILKLSENLALRPEQYPDAALWLRQKRLDRQAMLRTLYAVKGKELNHLRQLLELPEGRNLSETKTYIVLPYFSDWDQVATLRIEPASGIMEPIWWSLNPTSHAWMGLHSGNPTAPARTLRTKATETLKHINHSHDTQSLIQHLQLRWFEADLPGRKLTTAAVEEGDELSPKALIAVARTTGQLWVLRDNLPALDWRQHLYQQLHAQLVLAGYLLPARQLVDSFREDSGLCNFVAERLTQINPEWALQFRQQTSAAVQVARGGVILTETVSGYTIAKAGSANEQLLTNFLIKVDANVWFEDNDELWHDARVVINGRELPIRFSRRSAGKGDELESISATAVLRSGQIEMKTPVLFDHAHKKHLAALVNHQIAQCPRVEGIRQLGWNRNGTRFTASNWRAGALGVETPPSFRHPSNLLLLRHFTTQLPALSNTLGENEPLSLLAVVAAMLARGLRGVEVQPQPVFNNEEGQLTLMRLAAVFGQQIATSPKLNTRAGLRRPFDADDVNGLPLWLELDADTATRTVCPAFYLSETGKELPSSTDFAASALWVVQTLVQSLLQRAPTHTMPAEAGWERLVFEGQQLLQDRCTGPWESLTPEQSGLRRLLWRCGLDRLHERFSLAEGPWIRLNRQDLPREEQRALQEECLTLDTDVKVDGLDLLLPLNLFNQLVEENLGVRPTVERLRPKAGTARLATC